MSTVTISATNFEVYQDVSEASAVLVADLRLSPIWAAASDDDKKKALVVSTRWINRQVWKGTAVGSTLAWPRTGVTDRYGATVSDQYVPSDVLLAHASMAALILEDSALAEKSDQSVKTKRVKAGSVEVEFFAESQDGPRFPGFISDLLSQYLASSESLGRVFKTGDPDATSTSGFGDYSHVRGFY